MNGPLITSSQEPPSPPGHPETPQVSVQNSAINVIALILATAACFLATSVLLQIVCAFFAFFLLDPAVEWAARKRIPRKLSAIVVVLSLVAASLGMAWGGYGAFASLADEVPQYTAKIKKTFRSLKGQADQLKKNTSGIIPQTTPKDEVQKVEIVESLGGGSDQAVLHGVGSVFELLAAAFLVPILLLFLLLEKPQLQAALAQALPKTFRTGFMSEELSEMITGFFFGNVVVGLATAAGFYALFTYLHLDNRLLLALVAGFVNLVPMVGAILGGIFPAIQAFLQFDTPGPALMIFGSSVFLHFFVANFIIPKVVGSRINVNATAATIGLIFWGWLWGPLGLLLAVPLTASIRIILAARPSTEHLAKLIQEGSGGEMTRFAMNIVAGGTGRKKDAPLAGNG